MNPHILSPELEERFQKLKLAAQVLRQSPTESKNRALNRLAQLVLQKQSEILSANKDDLERLPNTSLSSFRDRLTLTPARVADMVESLKQVARLPDPVGEMVDNQVLQNGLKLRRIRAPLGVILMIFESRPNVVLEAFSLAFKTGNAIALRGGSESRSTAHQLYEIMREALSSEGFSADSFLGVNDYDRAIVEKLLHRKDLIDVVVPRGGDKLIAFVEATARMPIIKNDRGLCHAFVDAEADLEMALNIVVNAKVQRPGVCNSLETVLIHEFIAEKFLPELFLKTRDVALELRCDEATLKILKRAQPNAIASGKIVTASAADWDTEYLDMILNVKIVDSLQSALQHIADHGSKHSEVIVTANETHARIFQADVDAAVVYWNASTRFTDGFAFGLGGELGISTQKLHVRGPVGLRELTTPRWVVDGTGQIR
jgi:glutamate-5-semialdehyde dehydrogenase